MSGIVVTPMRPTWTQMDGMEELGEDSTVLLCRFTENPDPVALLLSCSRPFTLPETVDIRIGE